MKKKNTFALHGAIVYSKNKTELETYKDAYVISEDGICRGVFESIPEKYGGIEVEECEGELITPGFIDLHTHAPQYSFRGLNMDLELMEWLKRYTFPEEKKYADELYAERAYDLFVEDLYEGPTTRACVFATIDVMPTIRLMEMMEEAGLVSFVGKVNMDQNSPEDYIEKTEDSLEKTEEWINKIKDKFVNTYPILTPRFIPACSGILMDGLHALGEKYNLPVQSHLSENQNEIDLVKELEPESAFYGDAYARHGLFGGEEKTIMAHCVWSTDEEAELMKKNGVYVAHCPESNMNIISGIAPIRKFLDMGINTGLGSDIAGGSKTSILVAMQQAIQVSKLRYRLCDDSFKPLTLPEAFYLATKGGGSFFGKAGSFEDGYEFDAVIFDDENLATLMEVGPAERLERLVYCGDDRNVTGKYIRGVKIY